MSSKRLLIVLSCLALLLVAAHTKTKVRVYISDSHSWQVSGGFAGVEDLMLGTSGGGARPQTAEIIKTFNRRCPEVTVTNRRDRADYVVLLDHEGGKPLFLRDNKIVIFNKEGDAVYSGSTRSLGNAVKDACKAILNP